MKKIFLLLLLFPLLTFAQDDSTQKINLTLIDSVVGTKQELLSFAKSWITKTFVSAKAVIEMEDNSNGKLIGKVIVPLLKDGDTKSSAHFTITFDTKDNKYRCVFSDYIRFVQWKEELPKPTVNGGLFEINPNEKGFMQNSINKTTLKNRKKAIEESELLLSNLKNYMKSIREKSDF